MWYNGHYGQYAGLSTQRSRLQFLARALIKYFYFLLQSRRKVCNIYSKTNFWLPFLNKKSPEAWERKIFIDLVAGNIFSMSITHTTVSMYVFIQARSSNFYPTDTKLGTQVGLVNGMVQIEDGLCGFHRDPLGDTTKNIKFE